MKYNAVLDVMLSQGQTIISDGALNTFSATSLQGQDTFVLPNGSQMLLFFVDGVLYNQVATIPELDNNKTFYYNPATFEAKVLTGLDAGVNVSAFYAAAGISVTAQAEPVTLSEAKEHCLIGVADDDALITMLISAARGICETYTNISFINRTVTAQIINQLGGQMLPYGPVVDVLTFKDYYGDAVTDYNVTGVMFKQVRDCYDGEFTVSYTAGYPTLPNELKNAVLCQVAWMYDNRGDELLRSGVCEQAKLILYPLRRVI